MDVKEMKLMGNFRILLHETITAKELLGMEFAFHLKQRMLWN
jgi:hypothetical protein